MTALMTQAAYARHRNVSRQTVGRWKDAGKLVLRKNAAGKKRVDVVATDAALGVLRNPLKEPAAPAVLDDAAGPVDGSVETAAATTEGDAQVTAAKTARAMREVTDARISNLKFEKMAGGLVPRVEIEGVGPVCAATLHQVMARAVPDLARQIPHITSEREAQTVLDQAFFEIQSAFADQLLAFDGVAAGADLAGVA